MPSSGQCETCAHYEGPFTCAAFPVEIPDDIFEGFFDHRQPYPGDNGVRWEPAPGFQPNQLDEEADA